MHEEIETTMLCSNAGCHEITLCKPSEFFPWNICNDIPIPEIMVQRPPKIGSIENIVVGKP